MNTNEDFKAVYEKYLRFSVRIAKSIVKDEALAEDISQEVFYHLYCVAETIDISNERKLRAFITTTTINKAKDYFKQKYVRSEMLSEDGEELEVEAPGENLEEIILNKENDNEREDLTDKVLQRLHDKNPMNYDILIKTKFENVSPDDVAQEYGITRNNVNNRNLRTKLWLQNEIQKLKKRKSDK